MGPVLRLHRQIALLARSAALLLGIMLLAQVKADVPSFPLADLEGKPHNIREYFGQGRWVIVAVWSADCPICRREMYHMTFLHEEHKDKDVRVVGLSIDGAARRAEARDFADDQSLNFPNLVGSPGDAARLSGQAFVGTPTYYFFAPNGAFKTLRVGALTQAQAESVLENLKRSR